MKNYKYSIYRPGGNDTALVERLVLDPVLKRRINNVIMSQSPAVEQVGFVDKKNCQLEMAGGEFCGNAVRCAAYQFLKGRPCEVLIKVSGVDRRLKAGMDKQGNTYSQMPVYSDPKKVIRKENYWIVKMQGITQVVRERKNKFGSKDEAKKEGLKILEELDLLQSISASGVMFLVKTRDKCSIEPVVWVRDIKTLFYETACASGTAAVGIVTALELDKSIDNLRIFQPTNLPILVSVDLNNGLLEKVLIKGPIATLSKDISISI